MIVLYLILIGSILIIVLSTVVYYIYKRLYDRHNNGILRSGDRGCRAWISPLRLFIIIASVQFVGLVGVASAAGAYSFSEDHDRGTDQDEVVHGEVISEHSFGDSIGFSLEPRGFVLDDGWELLSSGESEDLSYTLYVLRDHQDDRIISVGFVADYQGDPSRITSLYMQYSFGTFSITTQNSIDPEAPDSFEDGYLIVGMIGDSVEFPGNAVFEIRDINDECIAGFEYRVEER